MTKEELMRRIKTLSLIIKEDEYAQKAILKDIEDFELTVHRNTILKMKEAGTELYFETFSKK